MFLIGLLLLLSGSISIACLYFYQKEKRGLGEFVRQSRRHSYHKNLTIAMQKKANRYLGLAIAFFVISLLVLSLVFLN